MTFDNNQPEANNIYRITTNLKENGWIWETSPLLLADAIQRQVPEVENTSRVSDGNMPVFRIDNTPVYDKNCAYVDAGWFHIFHYDFIAGNADAFSSDPNSIILTSADAQKYFGSTNIIGKIMQVDSSHLTVAGVVKDAPTNSSFQYTSFIPLSNLLKDKARRENDEKWENANYVTFIKTNRPVNKSLLAKKITDVYANKSGDSESTITLLPLQKMHFENDLENSFYAHGRKELCTSFLFLLFSCY